MKKAIFLDAGPLGLVTNPKYSEQGVACAKWLQSLMNHGIRVIVPEIADYEVRRELIRANKLKGLSRLDNFIELTEYLPISTKIMRQAALFWAQIRQQGQPTADDKALDGDVILAAQALAIEGIESIVATTNVGHLSRFVKANLWTEIYQDL